MTTQRWGIVGGGMLGMTLALWLRDRGHSVHLLEGGPQLGGLAAPWKIGSVVWDRHYHVILNSDTHLLALLDRLGLSDELKWVETKTGVYAEGRLYSVSNAIEYLRYPPLRLVDKLRMGWTILYAARLRDWKRLEKIPVEQWLRRHSGDHAFEQFWLPLLRSKLGDNYQKTSAAFIWTTIQRLYAARRSGLKKEMFGYVTGGYDRIIRRFEEALNSAGVEISTGTRVDRVDASGGVVTVESGTDSWEFDRVVLTLAPPLSARVIAGLDARIQGLMTEVAYQGIVCASLLSTGDLAGFYVTNITDSDSPFTGVIEMSALVDRSEFGGHSLVYLPRYTSESDPIIGMSDGDVEQRFLDALETMYPGFQSETVSAFKVSRIPNVFPIPTLAYSESVPPVNVGIPGVFAASSAHILNGTLNVNETIQLAARVLPVLTSELADTPSVLERDVEPAGRR